MTRTYNIHEAKTNLSKLLKQAGNGDDVFIAKAGQTIAKLVPARGQVKSPRQLGTAIGMGHVPDNFNEPDAEIEAFFNDGPIFPDQPTSKSRKRG